MLFRSTVCKQYYGDVFMDEKELWEKFAADGKVDNYLEYRKHLEMQGKMELKLCDENKCGGLSDKRTEYR